jgi:hypothetical protein
MTRGSFTWFGLIWLSTMWVRALVRSVIQNPGYLALAL